LTSWFAAPMAILGAYWARSSPGSRPEGPLEPLLCAAGPGQGASSLKTTNGGSGTVEASSALTHGDQVGRLWRFLLAANRQEEPRLFGNLVVPIYVDLIYLDGDA
jgi:hypothetical protein